MIYLLDTKCLLNAAILNLSFSYNLSKLIKCLVTIIYIILEISYQVSLSNSLFQFSGY